VGRRLRGGAGVIRRLARTGTDELICRGRQEASKRLERAGVVARAGLGADHRLSLERFRAFSARHFFDGAVSERTAGLLIDRMPAARDEVVRIADDACRRRFDLLGYEGLSFGDPIDWSLDPVSGRRAPRDHWSRLDPLVLGVVLAAIEKFRASWWQRLMNLAPWLGLPALGLIAYALFLGETDYDTVTAAVWEFPLVALGMAGLLLCGLTPRLPFRRVPIPGAAFVASIAYSAYLVQKLVIHFVAQFCETHGVVTTSIPALIGVQLCIYAAATVLFLAIERPFLQLRHRLTARSSFSTS